MIVYFHCDHCGADGKRLARGVTNVILCKKCGKEARRTPNAPSTVHKEVIDNGFMPRAVERLVDIDAMLAERAKEPQDE